VTITVSQLKAKLDAGEKLRLIDVREADEWAAGKLPTAEWIPLGEFTAKAPQALDQDEEIVVYCHHGGRSGRAQGWLLGQGYKKVLNLTGGIDAWSLEIDLKVPRY
jgi:adenylyltransferase/sulfurtransferase